MNQEPHPAAPQAGQTPQPGYQAQPQGMPNWAQPQQGGMMPPWAQPQQAGHQCSHHAQPPMPQYAPPAQYAPPPPYWAQASGYPPAYPHPHGYPQQQQAAYYAQAQNYGPHPAGNHPHDHQLLHGLGSFFNFRDERFVKGAITGAAITFLLTNDSVQKNAIKSLVKFWSMLQGGVEEIKERFQDAEAEIKAEEQTRK